MSNIRPENEYSYEHEHSNDFEIRIFVFVRKSTFPFRLATALVATALKRRRTVLLFVRRNKSFVEAIVRITSQ